MIHKTFKVGDKVKIIRSPFSSIKSGTIATIISIKFLNFGWRWTVYNLDTKPCHSFKEWELEKYEEE